MARRVIFFDDQFNSQRLYASELRTHGFDLTEPKNLLEFEKELSHPDFEVVVFGGGNTEAWQMCQAAAARFPNVPFLYVFVNDDAREEAVGQDEVHMVIRPLTSKIKFVNAVNQLARVGRLHQMAAESVRLASGSNAIEQMFTRLDVHHILDRVLNYFGSRLDVTNLHWVRWGDLLHIINGVRPNIKIELEMEQTRSPRMLSYREGDIEGLIDLICSGLPMSEIDEMLKQGGRSVFANGSGTLFVPVLPLVGEDPMGLIVVEGVDRSEHQNLLSQLSATLKLMSRFIEFGLSHWDSKHLAMKDDLTDLYNQRFLPVILENEINRAARRKQTFSILFLDLDYFKMVNDTRGHWIGSKLLKEIGRIVRASIRSCDYGFRYGGDEFVVVLPDTDIKGGQIVAERIRSTIEQTPFLIDGHEVRLTASVGLATFPDHAKTKEQMIQLADKAMYDAKRKSRNIVYVAS